MKPFRFGVNFRETGDRDAWTASAREAEALGYSSLQFADHFVMPDPLLSLLAAALATSTIRLGVYVLCNDFRHPVVLAREAATLDVLSGGRLELGVGAGWLVDEYEAAGLPFDTPSVRIARLDESIRVLKGLFGEKAFTFEGDHYRVHELDGQPKPLQVPHPPIVVGGSGPKILSLAAREADIVAFSVTSTPDGRIDCDDMRRAAFERKIEHVRGVAGDRFDELELNTMITGPVIVTDDREQSAHELLDFLRSGLFPIHVPDDFTEADILEAPQLLVGTTDQIARQLVDQRERYGISYVTVIFDSIHEFAPIVEQLTGT